MRIVLMGPPGVGKGTQAARVAAALSIPTISTGDIFRDHIARRTDIGVQLERMVSAGEYVPDDVTTAIVEERLSRTDCAAGFILDGYPRTVPQVAELDRILAARREQVDAVVALQADRDTLVERLQGRARDGGRSDDAPDVIGHRLDVYEQLTAGLLPLYDAAGSLRRIDGIGSPDEVTARILALLAPVR